MGWAALHARSVFSYLATYVLPTLAYSCGAALATASARLGAGQTDQGNRHWTQSGKCLTPESAAACLRVCGCAAGTRTGA
eukprot:366197-Chlamydomonas_euryale.AAC.3